MVQTQMTISEVVTHTFSETRFLSLVTIMTLVKTLLDDVVLERTTTGG